MKQFLLVLAVVLLNQATAVCGFVVTVGNGTGLLNPIQANAGDTGIVIPVFVSSTTLGGDLVDGVNLGFDIGAPSAGFTNDITAISITGVSPAISGSPTLTSNTSALLAFGSGNVNWDRRANVTFSSTQTITGPVHLFNLVFDTASSASSAVIPINFLTNAQLPTTTSRLVGIGSLTFDTPSNGSLQITAVPEPATTGLLGLGLVGFCRFARRRFSRQADK